MVEVIVGKQDSREFGVQFGVVVLEPGDLRCRVSGQDRIAYFFDASPLVAEARGDFAAFPGCRRIAPELHRRQYPSIRRHGHETVLLT